MDIFTIITTADDINIYCHYIAFQVHSYKINIYNEGDALLDTYYYWITVNAFNNFHYYSDYSPPYFLMRLYILPVS